MTTLFLSMRPFLIFALLGLGLILPVSCVDQLDLSLTQHINVVVVDGTITNLAEPQIIRLNRAKSDSLTGRFGNVPLTKAQVEVVVDSAQVIPCHETTDGNYQLPSDFRGQVGHAYQLRFTLSDGSHYQSTQQVMPAVPPIDRLVARFSLSSLPAGLLEGDFRSGFDLLIDTQDPAPQRNYYRWEWNLWEKQDWCRSCTQGYYMPNRLKLVSSYPSILIYQTLPDLLEDCFAAPDPGLFGGAYAPTPKFVNDYVCRMQCWDIIHSSIISLFSDEYSNGGVIGGRNVGQVPYYTQIPALVEVRQSSLTADAYRFFKLFEQQTQNTGGVADTPPTALVGNVQNTANSREKVVGYFTAGAVSSARYWLDKKDATGIAYGSVLYDEKLLKIVHVPGEQQLFVALNRRSPNQGRIPPQEIPPDFTILGGNRPPTAVCVSSDSRTPVKPVGWQD